MLTKRLLEINNWSLHVNTKIQRAWFSIIYFDRNEYCGATSWDDVSQMYPVEGIELIIFLNREKIYLYTRTIVVERMTQVRARSLLLSCENHLKIARRAIYAAISAGKWDDGVSSSFLTRFYHFTVRRKIGNKRRSEKRLMVILQQHSDQHSNQITYDYMQIHTWSIVFIFSYSLQRQHVYKNFCSISYLVQLYCVSFAIETIYTTFRDIYILNVVNKIYIHY